ncbi:MAG: PLDc N-terminal domain-containing protein, partial [Woeseiaceae bacterium]
MLSAVHAVMSSRTPQGSIAWAVSLVTFPYISVPAYWVLGRNKFNGYVLARQQQLELLDETIRRAGQQIERTTDDDPWRNSVLSGLQTMARVPVTDRYDVELLIDGTETFDSIFAG